jgi:plasmid maintenance system killer protein
MKSSEVNANYLSPTDSLNDRKNFVNNLGELLSQTREGVVSCQLNDNEEVIILYDNGVTRLVNVNLDSYMAIIKDVTKYV